MSINHSAKLSSSELAMLWSTYVQDSLALCVLSHFKETVDDIDIAPLIVEAETYAKEHLSEIKELYTKEQIAIPIGFTEGDVTPNTPRIFCDIFYLRYLRNLGRTGMATYAMAVGTSGREDVVNFFSNWLNQAKALYIKTTDILRKKGVLIRSPQISYPDKAEFVKNQSFLNGFLGEKRPLLALEISHISTNIEGSAITQNLMLGFSQVAKSNQVRKYLLRGHEILSKHTEVLSSILKSNHTTAPSFWGTTISKSTVPPFSDKLIMNQIGSLIMITIGNYGTSIAASLRKDLGIQYTRLLAEVSKYAEDGAELTIKNGWMENPPQTVNREALTQKK